MTRKDHGRAWSHAQPRLLCPHHLRVLRRLCRTPICAGQCTLGQTSPGQCIESSDHQSRIYRRYLQKFAFQQCPSSAICTQLTPDKAPASPLNRGGDQHSCRVILRPHAAGFGLNGEASSARHIGRFGGCQSSDEVIEVDVEILVYQDALCRLWADWCA